MKLVFAAGEFPPTLLQTGTRRIGSAVDADIPLSDPAILPQHCELQVTPQGVLLKIAKGAEVTVNGRPVEGLISLRAGDQMAFGAVNATLVPLDGPKVGAAPAGAPADDVGATTVRAALPKFALRALSGRMLGRTYPLPGPTIVGRSDECQLRIEDSNLSRKHAKLIPTNEGVVIEDLGSTNGSFHNGKRVQHAVAQPGDEIGFDTMRYQLIELGATGAAKAPAAPAEGVPRWVWAAVGAVAVAIAVFLML